MPSLNKPMRDQEKTLVRESEKIISKSIPKIGMKEVPAGWSSPHTNSGVCGPKEGVIPEKKILRREADTSVAKNKATHTRNSSELLPHVLPNAQEY